MGNEVYIESLLNGAVRSYPELMPFGGRHLLGLLSQVIEYYFEMDAEQCFTEVVFPLGVDSWFMGTAYVGQRFWEVDPSARFNFAAWGEFRQKFLLHQPMHDVGFRQLLPCGRMMHYLIDAAPTFDLHGTFQGYSGVVRDITALKHKDQYVLTVEHASIGISHISKAGVILFANHKFCHILGYAKAELIGMQVDQLSHPDDQTLVYQQRKTRPDHGRRDCIQVEKRYRHKSGDYLWVRLSITEMSTLDEDWGFDISVMEDITQRVQTEEKFRYLATHDELTALPNRMLFTNLLRHALEVSRRYSRQVAVLMIDLDRFKSIIDSFGHAAGDAVLQEIGQRVKTLLRKSDLVARFGGDEFIVMLQEAGSREQVAKVAGNILEQIMAPLSLFGHEARLSASIGIAVYPEDGNDETDLLRRADQAMYLAKAEGKNNFQFCPPEVGGASVGRIRMESLLHHAIERNELSLAFQAKFSIATNRVTGAEALLRWNNPELGQVSPAMFVPMVEELELILPIGRWVIDQACDQLYRWRQSGLTLMTVAVNLSPRQFNDPQLVDFIADALARHGLPGSALELEITEGVVMQRPDRAMQTLKRIKQLGVTIAIDDFGTGYSSLGQLKRLPVDTLKIDRTFIHEIEHSSEDKALTRAIITMAKTLGLSVVAEGVETAGQAEFLTRHGCDFIQGYYYSKPCAAAVLEKLVAVNWVAEAVAVGVC